MHRLLVFPIQGATPARVPPRPPAASSGLFTFDPLRRDIPLFAAESAAAITRAGFAHAPDTYLGSDITVRQNGVPLATTVTAALALPSSTTPFTFGGRGPGISLDATAGLRIIATDANVARAVDAVVTAEWQETDGTVRALGALGVRGAIGGTPGAFSRSATGGVANGVLRITLSLADVTSAWPPPRFAPPRPQRFPSAVIPVRAEQVGPMRTADGLYVYLPDTVLTPGSALTYWVADDGSTYGDMSLDIRTLARGSEGQTYPPVNAEPSASPVETFTRLNRGPDGMVVTDASRFGGVGAVFAAEVFTGVPQLLGAIPTADTDGAAYPELGLPGAWPAFQYAARVNAADVPGLLVVRVQALAGATVVPSVEMIVVNRAGDALLVYLPQIDAPPAEGVRFFVADDGSTYYYPTDDAQRRTVLDDRSLAQLVLARPASGQVWPIPGIWPLQQRIAVARPLDTADAALRLVPGQLGIDPELGRFALPADDPAHDSVALSVDYGEAFSDRVGALNFDRQLDPAALATRLVASSGDADFALSVAADAPIYTTLSEAVAAAADGDIIEITDSATYSETAPIVLADFVVQTLVIRARAGCRPCLSFRAPDGTPLSASLTTLVPMAGLNLNGLLIEGAPLTLHAPVQQVSLIACTLDPTSMTAGSLISDSAMSGGGSAYLLCRCVTGALYLGELVQSVIVADSIIDGGGMFAILGMEKVGSPPLMPITTGASVQLERVTVLGGVLCDTLSASECLLDSYVAVEDQQSGCIRFSRYEKGSILPRRDPMRTHRGGGELMSSGSALPAATLQQPPLWSAQLRPARGGLSAANSYGKRGRRRGRCLCQPPERRAAGQSAHQATGVHAGRAVARHRRGDLTPHAGSERLPVASGANR